ncbi:hypothetical protein OH76DRAFT_1490742 [Lentinus brumalis]|uniref:Uncharacterized protein n=1 Tax=Lentinus brumalis TaxID=2498619 RepID=A0A371CI22_9APHY|nr:hypothetical protein OH76DRAFT_1490742 [Polyporus brumalis]
MSRSSNSPLTVRVPGSRASSAVAYPAAYDPEEEQREMDAKLDEHVGVRDEVSAKMKQNAVRAPVPHTHPHGYVLEVGTLVRVRGARHSRTLHVVNYDAMVTEVLESRFYRKALVKVRALYSREDLDTPYLALSSRNPNTIRLVQGRHQVVLGDYDDIILIENIIAPLTDVARVTLDGTTLPILTHNARWIREDVCVAQGQKVQGSVLFAIDKQGVACCSSERCVSGRLYYPEEQQLRYCTHCPRWYHIRCMRQVGTVASIRAATYAPGSEPPSWIMWRAPANTPPHVANYLESLVTFPIQRGYLAGPPGAHPLFSLEMFSIALRQAVRSPRFQAPATPSEAELMLQNVLKSNLLENHEPSLREATAAIHWLAHIPMNERAIYQCPRRDHHVL